MFVAAAVVLVWGIVVLVAPANSFVRNPFNGEAHNTLLKKKGWAVTSIISLRSKPLFLPPVNREAVEREEPRVDFPLNDVVFV